MKLSFIIPHKGRVGFLRETLESVIHQLLPQGITEQEIIVVSQGPSEECQRIVDSFPQVRLYLESDSFTIAKLRNSGVARTDAELLAFIDADIRLAPHWVSTCFGALQQDSGRVLTSAVQACPTDAGWVERLRCMLGTHIGNRSVSFLDGRNLFTTRSAFEAVGGFPEHLVTCEDFFFTYALSRLGSLYVSAEASYIHIGEDKTLKTVFGKEIWRGQSNLQSLKGRTIPLREWPSIAIPLLLPLQWLSVLGGVVLKLKWFALAGVGSCLFPFALYSIRASVLSKNSVGFFKCTLFYTVYFTARALGTWRGAFLWRGKS